MQDTYTPGPNKYLAASERFGAINTVYLNADRGLQLASVYVGVRGTIANSRFQLTLETQEPVFFILTTTTQYFSLAL